MPDPRPEGPFDWIEGNGIRGRYAAGTRGWDERGYDTFEIEIGGKSFFGQIASAFLENGNDFNVEIVSFGFRRQMHVGGSLDYESEWSFQSAQNIFNFVVLMIKKFLEFKKRPIPLKETGKSIFMGDIIFRAGWILICNSSQRDGNELPVYRSNQHAES